MQAQFPPIRSEMNDNPPGRIAVTMSSVTSKGARTPGTCATVIQQHLPWQGDVLTLPATAASGLLLVPHATKASSESETPAPAPASTQTACPSCNRRANRLGTRATRRSPALTSRATAIRMGGFPCTGCLPGCFHYDFSSLTHLRLPHRLVSPHSGVLHQRSVISWASCCRR